MSAESLSLIAGAALSLAFSYLPGLHERFAALDPTRKRLVLLGLLVLSAAGVYGLSCLGWGLRWGLVLTCDRDGLAGLLEQLLLAVIASQGVYAISPPRPVLHRDIPFARVD
jgi:hypothetical protein